MEIEVPNLIATYALDFCKEIYEIEYDDSGDVRFDFSKVRTCNPFPMLIVSNEIRNKVQRLKNKGRNCYARNCNNDYANTMKFYSACGLEKGGSVDIEQGNNNYSSITKLSVKKLRQEGIEKRDVIQEVIEKKAKEMAVIVARNNKNFEKWLAYTIRELIRNIPEHSKSDTIWYCAQYWGNYDLVELAIMDEGIGIKESLKENINYKDEINTDKDAILLALEPGVSGKNIDNRDSFSQGEWENSGYGLYIISEMCAELGANFIIASGDSAIEVRKKNGKIIRETKQTKIHGTAIQIRIKPSESEDYDKIRNRIVDKGENKAGKSKSAIRTASKSSRG
ncbi:hypothetical protein [Eubacterium sp.]|uniref:hypothetical protein n=1 Tax=Eubacterium sp. TaxID=142586 RepID=UPI0025E7CB26|nr:hypothetical protein [Eubacterium sp.]MCR5628137.1 hypothetical protein [Eubacterium sp.]